MPPSNFTADCPSICIEDEGNGFIKHTTNSSKGHFFLEGSTQPNGHDQLHNYVYKVANPLKEVNLPRNQSYSWLTRESARKAA